MWGWLTRLLMQVVDDGDAAQVAHDLREAQAAREDAAQKLFQTEMMEAEVRGVAAWARSLRRQNHFSARITEAFGRTRDD